MSRIVFLTPEEIPYGFAIAGFEQKLVPAGQARVEMTQIADEPDVGVLVIDERLLAEVDDDFSRQFQEQWSGILLVLPTPAGAVPAEEDYLQRLIRRALGYHVRIRE